ncbi:MAG: PASTA domain-containing protein [Solirubrobacterales bacterium]|nr:PASTA domain-containing protein [Solirubrobacterales bacterium]
MSADRVVRANFSVKKCVVPRLKGKTLKKAKKALKRAHCKLGKVTGRKRKHGHVKKQKPKPGKVLAAGSKVSIKLG